MPDLLNNFFVLFDDFEPKKSGENLHRLFWFPIADRAWSN